VSEHAAQGPVAVGFSALIPAALAAVLVLTSWASTDRRDHVAATSVAKAPRRLPAVVEPATAATTRAKPSTPPPATDNVAAAALAWAVAELAAGRTAGRKVVLAEFGPHGLTDYQSRQVAAQAKQPHGHPLRLAAGQ
jgi:hypothetical protein